jgi:DNA-binding LacI/PurR family transcriptional regulator
MHSTPTLGRPADRRTEIVRELRQQIVDGSLPPGSQVPTRLEIEARFGVSPLTVQRALEKLRADGFITVNGRQGTYVATNPPHLSNFALVFPHQPNTSSWVRFWTSLSNEAAGLSLPEEHTLKMFHNINREMGNAAFEELSREVKAHRVAGLIFATSPHLLAGTPILDEPGVPRVAIQSASSDKKYPIVGLDRQSFFVRALDYLKQRGRKHVACIGPPQALEMQDEMLSLPAKHGLKTQPYWWQGVGTSRPETARNCAHLLMNSNQTQRPDALIISDDNLVEYAISGLLAAGVRVPQDVELVVHCNFPCPASSIVPCRRLGFDTRQVLNACIEVINIQRRGERAPVLTLIAPMFEDEVSTAA